MFLSPEYIFIVVFILVYLIFFPKEKWPFYVIMAYMIFLGVFRGLNVGTDHAGYERDFNILNSYDSMNMMYHRFEIGYVTLILLFKNFSSNYLLFSGLTFLIPMIGTMIFIKKYNINYAWALFVFFFLGMYFGSMNIMRQYMAICSIAAFTYLLKKRSFLKFAVVVVAFSMAFHMSSIIMLLLIPIFYYFEQKGRSISKKWMYLVIILSYILFYIGPEILAPIILGIMNVFPANDFSGYIANYQEAEISNAMATVYTLYALLVVYFDKSTQHRAEMMCLVLYIVAFNILNMFNTFAYRAALPFQYFLIALVPLMVYDNKKSDAVLLKLITFVFMLAVFFVSYVMANSGEINPYYMWL